MKLPVLDTKHGQEQTDPYMTLIMPLQALIDRITVDQPIVHFHQEDSDTRAALHDEIKEYPDYLLRSEYESHGFSIRCDSCRHWTYLDMDKVRGACCDQCSFSRIECSTGNCPGEGDYGSYIYFDNVRPFTDDKIKPGDQWRPTGGMILLRNGTAYKHLNNKYRSYRKRYATDSHQQLVRQPASEGSPGSPP